MRYDRYPPCGALEPYVEHYWVIEAELGAAWREEILVPNGRPTLLVSLGDTGRRRDPATGRQAPNASGLTGIGTRPVLIGQTGTVRLVAAQLSPFGADAVGAPPAIDTHLPLAGWLGPEDAAALQDDIARHGASLESCRRLEALLLSRLRPLPAPALALLAAAMAEVDADEGALEVEDLCRRLGISYARLYRLFRRHVGIAPKVMLSIGRYQKLVGNLLAGQRDSLAQLALLRGYYDQAHANRDFRRYTGVAPRAFLETLNGIARMMHGR